MNTNYGIICQYCSNYYDCMKQTAISAIDCSYEIVKSPELLQKVCLVGLPIFKMHDRYKGNHRFHETIKALNTAQTLDFFGFLRLPNAVMNNDFKWDLDGLKGFLKLSSILPFIGDLNFACADIFCVPVFLNEWKIIDLSSYSKKAGSIPLFGAILDKFVDQCKDERVRHFLCGGFFVHSLIAVIQLIKFEDIKAAVWLGLSSSTEFVFNFAILKCWDEEYVDILMFVTKSIGVSRHFKSPKFTTLDL